MYVTAGLVTVERWFITDVSRRPRRFGHTAHNLVYTIMEI